MKLETMRKAERLYTQGKIKLMSTKTILKFIVKGETDTYEIHYDRILKKWSCTCKGFSIHLWMCSHIQACHLLLEHESESLGL